MSYQRGHENYTHKQQNKQMLLSILYVEIGLHFFGSTACTGLNAPVCLLRQKRLKWKAGRARNQAQHSHCKPIRQEAAKYIAWWLATVRLQAEDQLMNKIFQGAQLCKYLHHELSMMSKLRSLKLRPSFVCLLVLVLVFVCVSLYSICFVFVFARPLCPR